MSKKIIDILSMTENSSFHLYIFSTPKGSFQTQQNIQSTMHSPWPPPTQEMFLEGLHQASISSGVVLTDLLPLTSISPIPSKSRFRCKEKYPHWAGQGATLAWKPHVLQVPVSPVKTFLAQLIGSHGDILCESLHSEKPKAIAYCQMVV